MYHSFYSSKKKKKKKEKSRRKKESNKFFVGKTWNWIEGTCAEKVIANLYNRRTGEEFKKNYISVMRIKILFK